MVALSPLAGAGWQFFTSDGAPLSGGKLYTYAAGTTTPLAAYTSISGGTAHANPIVLDSAGRVSSEVWLTSTASYKFTLTTSTDVSIWTKDNISGISAAADLAVFIASLAASSGSSLVGFLQSGTGATARTAQAKMRDWVSVKDFGAVGDGTTDDTAAINTAITSNRNVFFPDGIYLLSSTVTKTGLSNFALVGSSRDRVKIILTSAGTYSGIPIDIQTSNIFSVREITFDANNNASLFGTNAVVRILSCTDFRFENSSIINHKYIGLGVNSCSKFTVKNNVFKQITQINTTNYNLNVSSTLSVSANGDISGNLSVNSGIGVVGIDIFITNNSVIGTKYGSCIATFALGAAGTTAPNVYGRYIVQNNICTGANGTDADGFICAGMEIAGPNCLIENNNVYGNDGEGIRLFARQSICSGNMVWNNGIGLGGTFKQGGIVAYWSAVDSGKYSVNYSLIQNNMCFDTGAGTQLYGYAEQSTNVDFVKVSGNNFDNNATAPVYLQATSVNNSYDFENWFTYTPTIAATSGSLTQGTRTGQYIRRGRTVLFQASCVITANGTGAGAITITLPVTAYPTAGFMFATGRATTSGKMLTAVISAGSTTASVYNYDNTYPGSTGETIVISGEYRT